MRRIYRTLFLIVISVLIFTTSFAQERIISGQLKSQTDGSPLPGVAIHIKGTTTGTVTDAEGRYSISAPIGSVLVFSFVGMKTREYLVTGAESSSDSGKRSRSVKSPAWSPIGEQDTTAAMEGVATITSTTPRYHLNASALTVSDIVSIRRISKWQALLTNEKQGRYLVQTNDNRFVAKGFGFQYSYGVSIDRVGKLPGLQSEYAQGRAVDGILTWRGPDQAEPMSWGPPIKTLEYVGDTYPYNTNGTIVSAGNGNGKVVLPYAPISFFRTAVTNVNEITAFFPGLLGSTLKLDWVGKATEFIVPNNESRTDNVSLKMKRLVLAHRLTGDVSVTMDNSVGRLMSRGANISTIIGSVMRSSPTFDNQGGYRLSNGAIRSTTPEIIDNPYGLVNELPDREKVKRAMYAAGINYDPDSRIHLSVAATLDLQNNFIVNGTFPNYSGFPSGRRMERIETRNDASVSLNGNYQLSGNDTDVVLALGYQFKQQQTSVSRDDGFGFAKENFGTIHSADSLNHFDFGLNRAIHEVITKMNGRFRVFEFLISNRSYFSNTINYGKFTNFLPAASLTADLSDSFYWEPIESFKTFISAAKTVREAPSLFGNNSFLSTRLSSDQFTTFFENKEIVWNSNLGPETEVKFETGLKIQAAHGIALDIAYYDNSTSGLIVPVWQGLEPVLQNVATVRNWGIDASLGYHHADYMQLSYGFSLRWTKYNSEVVDVETPNAIVPLAGFTNVATVIAKGEPLGAIFGSSFVMDLGGHRIIGTDGFPLVDGQLKKIGNPIPRYLISFEPYFDVNRRFRFGLILDFRSGGQIWNGTKAALNYGGNGIETADQRHISNYVFDGVNTNGTVNSTPVSFYDPALSIEANRWVRYGMAGVGEENIEDGTWLRLNEVSVSYKLFPRLALNKRELALSLVGRNLFLLTRYSGVDPGTSLFGYASGKGLDLFNGPSTRSINLQITLKI